jgi:hypothetical protein
MESSAYISYHTNESTAVVCGRRGANDRHSHSRSRCRVRGCAQASRKRNSSPDMMVNSVSKVRAPPPSPLVLSAPALVHVSDGSKKETQHTKLSVRPHCVSLMSCPPTTLKFPELHEDEIKLIRQNVALAAEQRNKINGSSVDQCHNAGIDHQIVSAVTQPEQKSLDQMAQALSDILAFKQVCFDSSVASFHEMMDKFIHHFDNMNSYSFAIYFHYVLFRQLRDEHVNVESTKMFLSTIAPMIMNQENARIFADEHFNHMKSILCTLHEYVSVSPQSQLTTNNMMYTALLHLFSMVEQWIAQWSERFFMMNAHITHIINIFSQATMEPVYMRHVVEPDAFVCSYTPGSHHQMDHPIGERGCTMDPCV